MLFYLLVAIFGLNVASTATNMLIIKRGQVESHGSSGRFMATTLIPYYAGDLLGQVCCQPKVKI